jgi:hypothetical protein
MYVASNIGRCMREQLLNLAAEKSLQRIEEILGGLSFLLLRRRKSA